VDGKKERKNRKIEKKEKNKYMCMNEGEKKKRKEEWQ
jgi:hypothetical protein